MVMALNENIEKSKRKIRFWHVAGILVIILSSLYIGFFIPLRIS